jgi:hypothetical protein
LVFVRIGQPKNVPDPLILGEMCVHPVNGYESRRWETW